MKKPVRPSLHFRIWLAMVAGALLLAPFQNCSIKPYSSASAGSDSREVEGTKGNGDGYTGKVEGVYVNVDVTGSCSAAGSEKSKVIVADGKAMLTKENCRDIVPREVTAQAEVRDFNPDVLFLGQHLFERVEIGKPKEFANLVCRGVATQQTQGVIPFADIYLKDTGTTIQPPSGVSATPSRVFNGYVKLGTYDLQNRLQSSQEVAVTRAIEFIRSPQADYMIDHEKEPLTAPPVPGQGDLSRAPYNLQVINNTGRLLFGSNELHLMLVVDSMDCYRH